MSKDINYNYLRGKAMPADITTPPTKYSLPTLKKEFKLFFIFLGLVLIIAIIVAFLSMK